MEVKVINELRLNFMDPQAEATLHSHLRAFLFPTSDPAP
jgi:Fe-S cluster biosynthesis and repair protein YggX